MARGFNYTTTLGVCYSKMEKDYKIYHPSKSDGWLMYDFMKSQTVKDLLDELEKRGYDTQTLRISIKKKV